MSVKEPKIMNLLAPQPNILKKFDVFENNESLTIAAELCQIIILYDQIINCMVSKPEATSIMKKFYSAMSNCHHLSVIHQDLKLENILFNSRNNLKLVEWVGRMAR